MQRRITAERFPETVRIQFPKEGEKLQQGWRLVQEDLCLMERAADELSRTSYRGGIATRQRPRDPFDFRVFVTESTTIFSLGGVIAG